MDRSSGTGPPPDRRSRRRGPVPRRPRRSAASAGRGAPVPGGWGKQQGTAPGPTPRHRRRRGGAARGTPGRCRRTGGRTARWRTPADSGRPGPAASSTAAVRARPPRRCPAWWGRGARRRGPPGARRAENRRALPNRQRDGGVDAQQRGQRARGTGRRAPARTRRPPRPPRWPGALATSRRRSRRYSRLPSGGAGAHGRTGEAARSRSTDTLSPSRRRTRGQGRGNVLVQPCPRRAERFPPAAARHFGRRRRTSSAAPPDSGNTSGHGTWGKRHSRERCSASPHSVWFCPGQQARASPAGSRTPSSSVHRPEAATNGSVRAALCGPPPVPSAATRVRSGGNRGAPAGAPRGRCR